MIKHYLKSFLRNIRKSKVHSFINIIGLAIGIGACLLLSLWIQDELSYDRYHENSRRIYRVYSQSESNGQVEKFVMTPAPLAPALVNEFPKIEKAVKFYKNTFLVGYEDKRIYEKICVGVALHLE